MCFLNATLIYPFSIGLQRARTPVGLYEKKHRARCVVLCLGGNSTVEPKCLKSYERVEIDVD